jgi:RNA polymerase sigma-70 factor (ECF subfamily)
MRNTGGERELVGRMQAGDTSAVAELSSAYGPRIHQLAFRYMKNWEDAEEVTQDVLMKVFRKIDAFRGDAALSSWIYRITFNTAMSRLRTGKSGRAADQKQRTETASDDGARMRPQEPADWSSLADDRVMRLEMRERLIAALTKLPEVYRTPVVLRDIQGMSTEEASQVLRIKPQTLKSRLHRGRLILRRGLAEFAGGVALHARDSVN